MHGVVKQTIGGSLARTWPRPLPSRRRCGVLVLLLLGLFAAVTAAENNRGTVLLLLILLCAVC